MLDTWKFFLQKLCHGLRACNPKWLLRLLRVTKPIHSCRLTIQACVYDYPVRTFVCIQSHKMFDLASTTIYLLMPSNNWLSGLWHHTRNLPSTRSLPHNNTRNPLLRNTRNLPSNNPSMCRGIQNLSESVSVSFPPSLLNLYPFFWLKLTPQACRVSLLPFTLREVTHDLRFFLLSFCLHALSFDISKLLSTINWNIAWLSWCFYAWFTCPHECLD